MFIVTTAQMQQAEQNADAAGRSYDQLMEQAGQRISEAILAEIPGQNVLILVGPGNNGGDGLVVARYLAQAGRTVTLCLWKRNNLSSDLNWQRLMALEFSPSRLTIFKGEVANLTSALQNADVVVDALLGTGVSRPIQGSLANLLNQVQTAANVHRVSKPPLLYHPATPTAQEAEPPFRIVAVDLPSGLHSDTGQADPHTVPADLTVTLGAVKRGHIIADGPNVTGKLLVGDIGLTTLDYSPKMNLRLATLTKVREWLPQRPATAYKGTFGRAMIVAGSGNYVGAALLATEAATRSGVGWAQLACPRTLYPLIVGHLPCATYLPLNDEDGAIISSAALTIQEQLDRTTALLIGPGLGTAPTTAEFVWDILSQPVPPLVVDADGLNILAQRERWWGYLRAESILTPHPGEMARLTGQSISQVQRQRLEIVAEMAQRWGQVVLLKGAYTAIAAPNGETMVLPFATPALAKAGSGDVLAGIIVSLRAQGVPPFEAAVAGGYLHGLAGLEAAAQVGSASTTASDFIEQLPRVFQRLAVP